MVVEFNPVVKSINIASEDLTKITLEVKNDSLDGKYDDIRKMSGKSVSVIIVPEMYTYTIPYDQSTNQPIVRYVHYSDGTIKKVQEEQTQLDVDGKGNIDIIQKTFSVDKQIIDEYILYSSSFKFSGEINPREILSQLEEGLTFKEIAEEFEVSEGTLISELEHARRELAPYADSWRKNDVIQFKNHKEDTTITEEEQQKEMVTEKEVGGDDENSDNDPY